MQRRTVALRATTMGYQPAHMSESSPEPPSTDEGPDTGEGAATVVDPDSGLQQGHGVAHGHTEPQAPPP